MKAFDHISLIYNPKSTGEAPSLAREFKKQLALHDLDASLTPTKHQGHAVQIAKEQALKYKRPLLISVSGDGGYNEVITGAMQAKLHSDRARPVTAVIAAGNANDHKRVTRGNTPLLKLIQKAQIRTLDILQIDAVAEDFELTAYAHSYVGLGVTSHAGDTLNRHGKSIVSEVRALLSTFSTFQPFFANVNGKVRAYNNIIFGNINEMAKVVKLHTDVTLNDGQFDFIAYRHHNKFRMLLQLILSALIGVRQSHPARQMTITLPHAQLIQLDGEITQLPAECALTVTSKRSAMESLF